MFARCLEEESPKLAPLSIEHTQLDGDAQKCLQRFEAVILMCFGNVLRRALQRVECTAVVLARLVDGLHNSLIATDECLDVHFWNEVERGDRVVSRSVGAEQPAFALEPFP